MGNKVENKKEELKTNKIISDEKLKAIKKTLKKPVRKMLAIEKRIGHKMALAVSHVDKRNEQLSEKGERAIKKGSYMYRLFKIVAEQNKVTLLKYGSVIFVTMVVVICTASHFMAYEYSYNGKTLGIVKNQEDVIKVVDLMSQQMTKSYGAEVSIDKEKDISFKRVFIKDEIIDTSEDVLNSLVYMQSLKIKAWSILYDGNRLCVVDTKETAEGILDRLKEDYVAEHPGNYLNVTFAENVVVEPIVTVLSRLEDPEEVYQKAVSGGIEVKKHVVQSGETFSGIAKRYGLTQAELEEMNPGINKNRLSIGQELTLNGKSQLLTVQTLEESTYSDYIPYDVVYEENSSMYIGETRVKTAGVKGERQVRAKIVKNNGVEMAILELESTKLSDPQTEIRYKGTKELPPLQGTGTFKYPVSGYRLTSKFGTRWGRMHYGIDLACSKGTDIRASDGGTVIFAGYSGSYGYVVKIDHGGGFVTVYAHCSKMYVSKGTKVYQGQVIAAVGSTGRSTGPHCHFEIQKNGVQVNPLKYL